MAAKNLYRRGGVWWVVKRVPKPLLHVAEAKHIRKSTHTGDRRQAERAAIRIIGAELERLEALARGAPVDDLKSIPGLRRVLRDVIRRRDAGETDAETADAEWDAVFEAHIAAVGARLDRETGHPILPAEHEAALQDALRDPEAVRLSESIDDYLTDQKARGLPESTQYKMRRALEGFRDWLKADPPLSRIDRTHAGAYVSHLLKGGLSPATNKDRLGWLSTHWKWAVARGHTAHVNPWEGQSKFVQGSRRGREKPRRPFTRDEVGRLLNVADPTDTLWHLCALAAYTGMRLNEICHTETKDVDVDAPAIWLPEGKTESSVRQVPIHPLILPLVKHLKDASTDGYLLSGLKPGGKDNKRGFAIGKRAGRLIRKAGVADPRVVFHSLRGSFSTALDDAGVPKNIAESITGHKRGSMAYDTYSSGPHFETRRAAVEKATYGTEVDDAVRAGIVAYCPTRADVRAA